MIYYVNLSILIQNEGGTPELNRSSRMLIRLHHCSYFSLHFFEQFLVKYSFQLHQLTAINKCLIVYTSIYLFFPPLVINICFGQNLWSKRRKSTLWFGVFLGQIKIIGKTIKNYRICEKRLIICWFFSTFVSKLGFFFILRKTRQFFGGFFIKAVFLSKFPMNFLNFYWFRLKITLFCSK